MDSARFDHLTRALAKARSRRALAPLALLALLGAPMEAKKKKKKGGNGKKGRRTTSPPAGTPPDNDNAATSVCQHDGKSGCCQGNQRLEGTADTACGGNGEPCENCAAQGLICINEVGQLAPTCGCNTSQCLDQGGCCAVTGFTQQCIQGHTRENCGSDGKACIRCNEDQSCERDFFVPFMWRCCGREGALCDLDTPCCDGYECDTQPGAQIGYCRSVNFCQECEADPTSKCCPTTKRQRDKARELGQPVYSKTCARWQQEPKVFLPRDQLQCCPDSASTSVCPSSMVCADASEFPLSCSG